MSGAVVMREEARRSVFPVDGEPESPVADAEEEPAVPPATVPDAPPQPTVAPILAEAEELGPDSGSQSSRLAVQTLESLPPG